MNFSVYNADRAAHLTVVITALVAGIAIAAFASSVRLRSHHLLVSFERSR
jgi:hypothetical protein